MLKKLMLAVALAAAPLAFAQQNVDISGPDYTSGKADATLAALGRKAASAGTRLVITAPSQWHAAIEAKVHAGGTADVVMRDGFYENVLVRVEDRSAEAAKAEADRKAKLEAEKAARARDEERKADVERAAAAARAADAARAAEAARAARAPAAPAPKPAPAAPVAAPEPVAKAPAVDVEAIHARLEQSLIGGRAAEGALEVAGLQAGDTIYVDGPVRAVFRREGIRPLLFWLDGDLDLRRSELKVLSENRYQVLTPVRGDAVTLRREFEGASALVVAVPADEAPARVALERDFNDGRRIEQSLSTTKLHSGDIIYAGDRAAVVVRREGSRLHRYWLEGSLDLRQAGLQADGPDRYKVLNDTVR